MVEYFIDGPEKFIELIKEIGLEDPDIEILKSLCSARKSACCSGPRDEALRGIEAMYKKIIFTRLEGLKNELLEASRSKGCDAIRFKGGFKVNRREIEQYDKLIL
jgi:hypothetical protein